MRRNEANAEFEAAFAGVLDGSANAATHARLCNALRQRPALVDEYIDLMQMHALLLWREGRAIAPAAEVSGQTGPGTVEVAEVPLRPDAPRRRWRSLAIRASAVAALGIVIGVLLNLCLQPSPDRSHEVVERLVSWDLEIAQAPTKDEREAIYTTQADNMRGLVAATPLATEDRDLAQNLVDTSAWLTRNDDPVAEAERFGDIADQLLARLDSATVARDSTRITAFADSYRRVSEVGVSVNLDRAAAVREKDPKHDPKLDRLLAGDAGRAKRLEDILDRHPDASWKAVHRALKGHRHKAPASKPPS